MHRRLLLKQAKERIQGRQKSLDQITSYHSHFANSTQAHLRCIFCHYKRHTSRQLFYLAIQVDFHDNFKISLFPKCFASLSAGIATSSAELVLVIDLVGAVAGDARGRYVGLLHAVDGRAGRVVFAADFGVAGVGGVVVEGGDFGDVLAVGLALVLNGLLGEVLVVFRPIVVYGDVCRLTWFWTGALDMFDDGGLGCLLSIDAISGLIWMKMVVSFVL